MAEFPHCNTEVLHAPGECYYCDLYPSRQAQRAASGGTFSPLEANGWTGNIAVKAGEIHEHMGARFIVGEPQPQADKIPSMFKRAALRLRLLRSSSSSRLT